MLWSTRSSFCFNGQCGKIFSSNGQVTASVDHYASVTLNGEHHHVTVRTGSCELVGKSQKCSSCKSYRDTLRAMYNRWCKRRTCEMSDTSSHSNERYLNTPEKKAKMSKLKQRAHMAEKEIQKLRVRIAELTQQQGDSIDPILHGDLLTIMNENYDQIKQAYPEGSFARLFWEEQLKAASVKDPRQIRWHPLMIKWCLNLKLISSAAYHTVRTSGFLRLPSERTLRDYTHYFKSQPGFQPELNQHLQKEIRINSLPQSKRYVALLIDEMKIKEDLVYDKHTGQIIGFVSVGDLGDILSDMERRCTANSPQLPVSNHILVLMVRGIFFKLEFPYAHFGTRGVTADVLFPIVWEAIRQLESIGCKVICVTADGASPNRKFFRLHGKEGDLIYKTKNPFADPKDERFLFFISDPPHLIKTTRNCWSHSGVGGTRRMKVRTLCMIPTCVCILLSISQINGKFIEWKHIRDLYQKFRSMAPGISLVPKLKMEHIELSSFSRMRVDLAAQVRAINGNNVCGCASNKSSFSYTKDIRHCVIIIHLPLQNNMYTSLRLCAHKSYTLTLTHTHACMYDVCNPPPYTQVLSKSVADAFAYFGDNSTTETEIFVRNFDRLFDCLNVRSLSEWKSKAKSDLKPYARPDDCRLKVCNTVKC